VLVFASAEGDAIYTESKFVPNTPVRQGQVLVLEQKTGKSLLTGQTDNQGKFSFKIPAEAAAQRMDLKIVVEAAMGHQGEWLLKADKYLAGAQTAPVAPPAAVAPPVAPALPEASGTKTAVVDRALLEEAVNKALERQLAPVKEMLTELTTPRASWADIIGGVGYILGLFGLWAYFLSRRRKES
jgi:nickel transport protein